MTLIKRLLVTILRWEHLPTDELPGVLAGGFMWEIQRQVLPEERCYEKI